MSEEKLKTFVTGQRMMLFTQVMILVGLAMQVGLFFAYLWYGSPPAGNYALIIQFFFVAAVWIMTINAGVVLFWWVSGLGAKQRERTTNDRPKPRQRKQAEPLG
ncbi:MAG: hypothetical protein EAX95_11605 [Candidatus Thorarchaeota archaeon]|nr:hypothetical protein [Candidatus Thorarchaeota archaeon]